MESTRLLLLLSFGIIFSSCSLDINSKEVSVDTIEASKLIGAWEMKDFYWVGADTTYAMENAQPGIFYFTSKRYGIMWTPDTKPRQPFRNLSNPTEEEIIAGFKSVIFNGGTYEFTDSTVTTTAQIAKVPGFEGGKQFYRYKIVEDQLTLTMYDETYPDGSKPSWSGKWQTKFVMQKTK